MDKRIDIVCGRCGSREVTRDAGAQWDADAQEWVLLAVYDGATCEKCEDYTTLREVELADAE